MTQGRTKLAVLGLGTMGRWNGEFRAPGWHPARRVEPRP